MLLNSDLLQINSAFREIKFIYMILLNMRHIPFIFQVAALLAAFTHPSHIVIYAPGDSFTCRRAATRNLLGIVIFLK
ncbi:hypothetical protein BDD30_0229 [Photorhabdus asymbiotica]|uniref:Uncharacterized protein n=1 Tax=Photorhabdus asymbiotica TaxID=291112 RepID=A0ABX9SR73_9GAMM|nr:hypothetical protein BDD30_0229 [Photorhabdus asymbiotica]